MCFYNDYDWTAAVYCDDVVRAEIDRKCRECRGEIKVGEYFREIEMWEHEECQRCYGEWGDKELDQECDCDKPDLGEHFHTRRCLSCDQFLRAIEAAEIAEGCEGQETRPSLEGMIEEIRYAQGIREYFAKARELFPNLETSGYLKRIETICGIEEPND